jgi:hypothetical protein
VLIFFSVRQASSRRGTSRDFASSLEDKEARKEAAVAGHAEEVEATGVVTVGTEATGASGETTRVAATAKEEGAVEVAVVTSVITVASNPSPHISRRSISSLASAFPPAAAPVYSYETIARLDWRLSFTLIVCAKRAEFWNVDVEGSWQSKRLGPAFLVCFVFCLFFCFSFAVCGESTERGHGCVLLETVVSTVPRF